MTVLDPVRPAAGRALQLDPVSVGYVVSRFPLVTETFIVRELDEVATGDRHVELLALVREQPSVVQPEARRWVDGLITPRLGPVLRAQLHRLRRRPLAYLACWWAVMAGCWRSPAFLLRGLAVVPAAARFAVVADERDLDRLHAHFATHSALAAHLVHRLTGRPYGFTVHAHDLYVDTTMLAAKVRAADLVVAISRYNAERLEASCGPLPEDRVQVVRSGVDVDRFAPMPARAADGVLRILTVASLQPYKGHRHLVDAVARLRGQGVGVHLELLGDGDERGALEAQVAAAGLDDHVTFLGAGDRGDVLVALARADVMALPSIVTPSGKMEGIPVALMEAMACGRPVVASALSGIPELVDDDTGWLVPPADAAALADVLATIAADPAAAADRALAGRRRVERDFDLRQNVARLTELFDTRRSQT